MSSNMSYAHAFHLQEHEHVRREIEADKDYLRKLSLYVVVGTGTVWSWILINASPGDRPQVITASLLPILFTIFGAWRTAGLVTSISRKAGYLREVEIAMPKLGRLQGWERWWVVNRGTNPHWQDWAFWIVLLLVTIAAPILYIFIFHAAG